MAPILPRLWAFTAGPALAPYGSFIHFLSSLPSDLETQSKAHEGGAGFLTDHTYAEKTPQTQKVATVGLVKVRNVSLGQ